MKNKLIVLASIGILTISSCVKIKNNTSKVVVEEKIETISKPIIGIKILENSKWRLLKMDNILIANDKNAILQFGAIDQNAIAYNGVSFVNNYGGNFVFDEKSNSISEKGYGEMTQMASIDDETNRLEGTFMNQLNAVSSYEFESDLLLLKTKDGKQLVFKKI